MGILHCVQNDNEVGAEGSTMGILHCVQNDKEDVSIPSWRKNEFVCTVHEESAATGRRGVSGDSPPTCEMTLDCR